MATIEPTTLEKNGTKREATTQAGLEDLQSLGFTTISPENLEETPTPDLPDAPVDEVDSSGIIAGAGATTDALTQSNQQDQQATGFEDLFKQYLGEQETPPSLAGQFEETSDELGISGLEKAVTTAEGANVEAQRQLDLLNAEMKGLLAEAKAAPIETQVESERRGRTAGGVAPLNAAKLRRIALRSLPLEGSILAQQAEVLAAQGNLTASQNALNMAQKKLETLFNIKSTDATNEYNYRTNLINKVYDFATAEEQRKLDAKKTEEANNFTLMRDNIAFAQGLSTTAMANGQADVAAEIAKLDPNSPTFRTDLARLQANIVPEGFKYVASPAERDRLRAEGYEIIERNGKTYAKKPDPISTVVTQKGDRRVLMNSQTGEVIQDLGSVTQPPTIAEQLAIEAAGGTLTPDGRVVFDGVDPITGEATDPTKVVTVGDQTYDFTSYAEDENWGVSVNQIMSGLPDFQFGTNTLPDENGETDLGIRQLQDYIDSKSPDASISASDIKQAADEAGVPVEVLSAILQKESNFGDSNVARKNNNYGGVTWNNNFPESMKGTARPENEGGNYVKFASPVEGLKAITDNINRRKTTAAGDRELTEEEQLAQDIFSGVSTAKLSDISTKNNLRGKVTTELNKLKEKALESGDIVGVIRASAGGKDVDATAITSFEKALTVLSQLEDLNKSLEDEAIGPIIGVIRSNNTFDEKARQIKAQLTAIIPNLARGVFGEVGVLTDNDIALYQQTLPNLTSQEDLATALLGITVKTVQRAIENKIKLQAGLGRDVSGIEDIYLGVKETSDNLLNAAGINSESTEQYPLGTIVEVDGIKYKSLGNNQFEEIK